MLVAVENQSVIGLLAKRIADLAKLFGEMVCRFANMTSGRAGRWPPSRARAGVLLVCAGLLVGVDQAPAMTPLRRLAAQTVAFATDGGHYAAWQVRRGGPVTVLDTRSGLSRAVQPSASCELYDRTGSPPMSDPAGGGRFLLVCDVGTELLDARSGALTMLPATGPYDPGWRRVGQRYVEGETKEGCTRSSAERRTGAYCIALYELATGAVSYRPQSQLPDTDLPGAPVICAALRAKLSAERMRASSEGLFSYSDGVLARRGRGVGDVEIDRCRARPTLLHGPGEAQDITLAAGLLSWDTGRSGELYDVGQSQKSSGTLITYRLASRHRHVRRLPRLPLLGTGLPRAPKGVFGYSTHNADCAFWFAAQKLAPGREPSVEISTVYSARIG